MRRSTSDFNKFGNQSIYVLENIEVNKENSKNEYFVMFMISLLAYFFNTTNIAYNIHIILFMILILTIIIVVYFSAFSQYAVILLSIIDSMIYKEMKYLFNSNLKEYLIDSMFIAYLGIKYLLLNNKNNIAIYLPYGFYFFTVKLVLCIQLLIIPIDKLGINKIIAMFCYVLLCFTSFCLQIQLKIKKISIVNQVINYFMYCNFKVGQDIINILFL